MDGLRSKFRSIEWVYHSYRALVMFYKRNRQGLRQVHKTFYSAGSSRISKDFIAGPFSFVNDGCDICPNVTLGAYSMFGPRVTIVGRDHRFDLPGTAMIFSGRPPLLPTVVEDDAWVGYGVIIMAGCRIGRGAIVAAGAVVTKDIPPYEIFGGVPARKIGERFPIAEDRRIHEEMLLRPPIRGKYPKPLAVSEEVGRNL